MPPGLSDELLERWTELAGPGAAHYGRALLTRYRQPHRRYHTAAHLAHVLDVIDMLAGDADDPAAVRYAAWFHDAVYETGGGPRPTNEERSARLAQGALKGMRMPGTLVAEVSRLVRCTTDHLVDGGDHNGAVLCDADLAILGATREDYLRYTALVREEYREIPDDRFRSGRAAILRALLERPSLYRTATARERYGERARANLSAELAALTSN
jgi:predicted metal-dependent HD superfamily phosphohydrolase